MHCGTGSVDGFKWIEIEPGIWDVESRLKRIFRKCSLLIACFDSGPIFPSDEEKLLGWQSLAAGMLSPPLHEDLALPSAHCDEWWVFENPDQARKLPSYKCFVNHGQWTLRTPAEIEKGLDTSWDNGRWDWLLPLQARFWDMAFAFQPLAYIAKGDALVVASRNEFLFDGWER
jgi:hypothetical protein